MPDAYKLLMRTSQQIGYTQIWPDRYGCNEHNSGRGEGLMFAQHGGRGSIGGRENDTHQAAVPGRNEILHEKVRCYSCHQNGHNLDQFPNQTGMNLEQVGVTITHCCADIKNTWVLLETTSTNSVSNNMDLVKEIIPCKNHEKITVPTNGGQNSFDKKATLKTFPMTVHFN